MGTYSIPVTIARDPARWTLAEAVRWAVAIGADVLQLCENLPVPAEDVPAAEWRTAWRAAQDADLRLELGTRGIDPDRLARCAERAAEAGSSFVRLVMDRGTDEPTVAEAVTRLAPIVAAIAPVRVAIENHDRFSTDDLLRIVTDANCAIVLDTANSLGALEDLRTVLGGLATRTVCFHVKDVTVTRVPSQLGLDVRGAPAGEGLVDVAGALTALREANAPLESVIVEHWTPDVADPVRWEQDATVRGLANLKRLLSP
ncbi:MAG: TIM barrel protein [Fimbriimonadaceae bacterium]|nr:TIM barrel protein [Fimbriimonadaceae bacterium]